MTCTTPTSPRPEDLPTSAQLLKSTILAGFAASAILITVVFPAELGYDPLGTGRVLGLTEMGRSKHHHEEPSTAHGLASEAQAATMDSAVNFAEGPDYRSDEVAITLAPGEAAEVKLIMKAGASAGFAWSTNGGELRFDTHGNGGGQSISYEKGGATDDVGMLEAAFDGDHGWYWRNRGDKPVTVTLRTIGAYADMKRVL